MPYVLLGLAVFGLITSTVFAGIVLWAVPGFPARAPRRVGRSRRAPRLHAALSVFKPLQRSGPRPRAYLESFFVQDYPAYEILFCARSPEDAGLAVARTVAARYPHIPVKFLATGGQPDYINDKVISLEKMEAAAAHDIIVISDSDVRVDARLSARRCTALRRCKRRWHVLPLSRSRCARRFMGAARSGRHVRRNVFRRARGARNGRHAIHPRPHHGLPPRNHSAHGRL